jgi:two-component system chemotaxis response regulator CheY
MRILLVEDYDGFAESATALLGSLGFKVTDRASTGFEAVELIANADYDAVVTDFEVPGPTGDMISKVALSHDTPLVVLWSSIPRDREVAGTGLAEDERFHLLGKGEIRRLASLLADLRGDE